MRHINKLFSLRNISLIMLILTITVWTILFITMKTINAAPILTNDTVNHYQNNVKIYQKSHHELFRSLIHSEQDIVKKWQPEVLNVLKEQQSFFSKNTLVKTNLRQPILLFISFSLPDRLLTQYQLEASRLGIPLVLRGLYHHSFPETAKKLFMLLHQNNRGGVIINPIWFESYRIKQVPALVIQNENYFDVIYGNLSIINLLDIIKFHDTHMKKIIRKILGGIT